MAGWLEDVYFKKRLDYTLYEQHFVFDVAELLFSSHDVDLGTQFLLRRLLELDLQPRSILDLGCGYGVIGIVLARFFPDATVLLSDKDLLAVHYTQHNLLLNQSTTAQVVASISTDDLPAQSYDLIVSNVPGHIGDTALAEDFMLKPYAHLHAGGCYAMVVVHPIRPMIESVAEQYELALELIDQRTAHAVYLLTKPV